METVCLNLGCYGVVSVVTGPVNSRGGETAVVCPRESADSQFTVPLTPE